MCIINSDKAKYEVEICDKKGNCIVSVKFSSISTLCRFLCEFNFDLADCNIYRCSDLQYYDPDTLLSLWKGFNDELRT